MDVRLFNQLNIHYHTNENLARQLLPFARKFLSMPSKLTNTWDYKNTYTDLEGLALETELDFFVDYITDQANQYLITHNLKIKQSLKLSVSLFTSEMAEGDQHTAHNHPGALLSGLIYLNVPNNSAPLEFYSPRSKLTSWLNYIDELCYVASDEIFEITENHAIVVKPKNGLFLLWESWALHRVPKNNADERITMVFNIGVADADQL
tara:strand:+ start:1119 stop:1739 length:621 start_codon:yes stop_codon:yes gene_type:complete